MRILAQISYLKVADLLIVRDHMKLLEKDKTRSRSSEAAIIHMERA